LQGPETGGGSLLPPPAAFSAFLRQALSFRGSVTNAATGRSRLAAPAAVRACAAAILLQEIPMFLPSLLPKLTAAAAVTLLAWSSLPSSGTATPSPLHLPSGASASFLAPAGSVTIASSLAAGAQRILLPSSVLPNNQPNGSCSVETSDPGNPPRCSAGTLAGVVQRCSAHVQMAQKCSAFLSALGGNRAHCSTLAGHASGAGPVCSVLQPALANIGPSQCSAFGGQAGAEVVCSVITNGTKQFCSAENPASTTGNMCSTFQSPTTSGGSHACSAVAGGATQKNFCSTRGAAPAGTSTMLCSSHARSSSCSVRSGQKGQCTSLMNAPTGSCSAFAAGSHCSVIGGAAGTTLCKWP
jgi:hypothetical protein